MRYLLQIHHTSIYMKKFKKRDIKANFIFLLLVILIMLCGCNNEISSDKDLEKSNLTDNLADKDKKESEVNKNIDLSDFIDLTAENFVAETGMALSLEQGEEGDYYIGYNDGFELDFDELGIFNINMLVSIDGYNFYGVEVGMDIEKAKSLLKKQDIDYQSQEHNYYVYNLDSTGYKSLFIEWDKDKVKSIVYSCER